MLFVIDLRLCVSWKSLNICDWFRACLILDPTCSVLERSSLGSQVSWLPACFGTCEEAPVRGEEEDGREKLSVSPVSLPGVLSSFSSSSSHVPTVQARRFQLWSGDPALDPGNHHCCCPSLDSLSSSLYQLNNNFPELFSLLETPEGVSVVLLIS